MNAEIYMYRCLELAALGAGHVAPNPMVGAVLVHDDRVIGEGWHRQYGQAHAEVNCINQALEAGYGPLFASSVLYVSLEPCAHFGKTPPCADLIIQHKIPTVVIGCRDPFEQVNGKGIEKLIAAGVDVKCGILEDQAKALNARFFTFHLQHRPYVILKWAQTADGFIAKKQSSSEDHQRLLISNEYSNRLVHKWRSEEASILVGTETALRDDPALTNRLWSGRSPVRLIIDRSLRLPVSLKLFDGEQRVIIFNTLKQEEQGNRAYYQIAENAPLVPALLEALYRLQIQSVLVEGGARLLQSFIDERLWDEARIIHGNSHIGEGLSAPGLTHAFKTQELKLSTDRIEIFLNTRTPV